MDKYFVPATEYLLDGWLKAWSSAAKFVAAARSTLTIAARTTSSLFGFIFVVDFDFVRFVVIFLLFVVLDSVIFVIYAGVVTVHNFIGIIASLTKVLCLDVTNVEEAVATYTKVYERGLDTGFDIDDLAFVNVANPVILTGPLRVEFF